jgi:hypothetical protein
MQPDPTAAVYWSPDTELMFERAQHILRGIIAAYSYRIDGAPSDVAARLRDEQAEYVGQLSQLNPDAHVLEAIINEYPARLESLRRGD